MTSTADSLTLIRTKLNRPQVTDDLVPRPRLMDLLNAQVDRSLTLVTAPAGYGKTTLVACWLKDHPYSNCWLSLDEYDDDLDTFLAYLTAAIRRVYPDTCREIRHLLEGVALPPVQVIASSLINELELLPAPLVLVLDDYHTIRDPAIHELLDVLVRYPPDALRLVLISRRDPMLPLAKLRAQGRLAEVRAHHLRFTSDEVDALLKLSIQRAVNDSEARSLEEMTEGWIVGLRLALLTWEGKAGAGTQTDFIAGMGKYVADYLMSEVFVLQPADIQDFLVRSSIFDRISAPLCEVVLGSEQPGAGFQAFLTSAYAANLFVISLDAEARWFRYHHLFQHFLQGQLRSRFSASEIAAIHGRAAEWFSAEGLIEEALRHFTAAGDYDGAAQLLIDQRHALMGRGNWSGIRRYLDMLPSPVVAQEPELLVQKAWNERIQWQSASMRTDLERAKGLLIASNVEDRSNGSLWAEIDALEATLSLQTGESQEAVNLLQSAVKAIDEHHSYVRGYSTMLLANAYQTDGKSDTAVTLLSDAMLATPDDTQLQLRLWSALGLIHYLQANLDGAWLAGTRYNEISQGRAEHDGMRWGEYRLATVSYLRNELAVAEQSFRACSDRPRAVHTMTTTNAAIGLAMTHQAQGRPDQAREIAERNVTVLEALGHIAVLPLAEAFRAELAARQGRLAVALAWAPHATAVPMDQEYIGFYAPQLALPKILLLENTPKSREQACTVLAELRELMEQRHNKRFLIEVLTLQAHAHYASGNRSEARDNLRQAVQLAEPGRFLRPFVDLGTGLLPLLRELVVPGNGAAYAEQIIDAFGTLDSTDNGTPAASSTHRSDRQIHPDLIESLTNREMDVLMLLADRLTNKEIARDLGISSETVKQHTINLYRKLHVDNRRQAANAARTLGML